MSSTAVARADSRSRMEGSKVPPRQKTDLNPSEVTETFFLYAFRETEGYPKSSSRCGKWLIFVPNGEIDGVWRWVKAATEEGRLGDQSKVSTARPNPNAADLESKVICVYTYDWQDVMDVHRIRDELRALGITRKIPYKADEDTYAGRYRIRGHQRISKYYE